MGDTTRANEHGNEAGSMERSVDNSSKLGHAHDDSARYDVHGCCPEFRRLKVPEQLSRRQMFWYRDSVKKSCKTSGCGSKGPHELTGSRVLPAGTFQGPASRTPIARQNSNPNARTQPSSASAEDPALQ